MILTCNSCEKKFVVPDNAIGVNGRLVQCSSCGNQWKQFPVEIAKKKEVISKTAIKQTITKPVSTKKPINPKKPKSIKRKVPKKTKEINLYSPEYLAKKHGIIINSKPVSKGNSSKNKTKVNFGFYSSLTVFIVVVIASLRLLYFGQDVIVDSLPITEIYIDYLFESIKNLKDIIQNFFSNY